MLEKAVVKISPQDPFSSSFEAFDHITRSSSAHGVWPVVMNIRKTISENFSFMLA